MKRNYIHLISFVLGLFSAVLLVGVNDVQAQYFKGGRAPIHCAGPIGGGYRPMPALGPRFRPPPSRPGFYRPVPHRPGFYRPMPHRPGFSYHRPGYRGFYHRPFPPRYYYKHRHRYRYYNNAWVPGMIGLGIGSYNYYDRYGYDYDRNRNYRLSGRLGRHCQTSVRTCLLKKLAVLNGGCSCKVKGGRARGRVVP